MQPDGEKHSSFSVQNNLGGAQTISNKVVSALAKLNLSHVVIGIEATSVYGDNLMCFLREDGALGQFERNFHILNPKQVKKFKDIHPDLPKNDPVEAFVIADNLKYKLENATNPCADLGIFRLVLRFGRITNAVYLDDYLAELVEKSKIFNF